MEDQTTTAVDAVSFYGISVRGFTFLEMLIVMIVLGIAALITLPNMRSTDPHKLNILAAELAAAYVHARDEAQRTTLAHGVTLDAASTRIRPFRTNGTLPVTPIYDLYRPIAKNLYDFRLKDDTVLGDVDIQISETFNWSSTCDTPTIVFDGTGRPNCIQPWGVQLISAIFVLSGDGHSRAVKIEGETGRISVK